MTRESKLSLNRETLKALSEDQQAGVAGGLTVYGCTAYCWKVTYVGPCKTDLCGGTTSR